MSRSPAIESASSSSADATGTEIHVATKGHVATVEVVADEKVSTFAQHFDNKPDTDMIADVTPAIEPEIVQVTLNEVSLVPAYVDKAVETSSDDVLPAVDVAALPTSSYKEKTTEITEKDGVVFDEIKSKVIWLKVMSAKLHRVLSKKGPPAKRETSVSAPVETLCNEEAVVEQMKDSIDTTIDESPFFSTTPLEPIVSKTPEIKKETIVSNEAKYVMMINPETEVEAEELKSNVIASEVVVAAGPVVVVKECEKTPSKVKKEVSEGKNDLLTRVNSIVKALKRVPTEVKVLTLLSNADLQRVVDKGRASMSEVRESPGKTTDPAVPAVATITVAPDPVVNQTVSENGFTAAIEPTGAEKIAPFKETKADATSKNKLAYHLRRFFTRVTAQSA